MFHTVSFKSVQCLEKIFTINAYDGQPGCVNKYAFPSTLKLIYGMKHTVQEFLLHHDLLGVQIFHIMEKGLFIVQMIKSKANNVCMRGQDN